MVNGTVGCTDGATGEEGGGLGEVLAGVAIAVVASVGINIGNNMQALGLKMRTRAKQAEAEPSSALEQLDSCSVQMSAAEGELEGAHEAAGDVDEQVLSPPSPPSPEVPEETIPAGSQAALELHRGKSKDQLRAEIKQFDKQVGRGRSYTRLLPVSTLCTLCTRSARALRALRAIALRPLCAAAAPAAPAAPAARALPLQPPAARAAPVLHRLTTRRLPRHSCYALLPQVRREQRRLMRLRSDSVVRQAWAEGENEDGRFSNDASPAARRPSDAAAATPPPSLTAFYDTPLELDEAPSAPQVEKPCVSPQRRSPSACVVGPTGTESRGGGPVCSSHGGMAV